MRISGYAAITRTERYDSMPTPLRRDPEDIAKAAQIFKALSHPGRLEIACRLADQNATQKEIVAAMGLPQSSVARLLAPLRELELISGERQGQEIELSVSNPVIRQLVESVCDWLHPDDSEPSNSNDSRDEATGEAAAESISKETE